MPKATGINHRLLNAEEDLVPSLDGRQPEGETLDALSVTTVLEAMPFAAGVLSRFDDGELALSRANPAMEAIIGDAAPGGEAVPLDELSDLPLYPEFQDAMSRCHGSDTPGSFEWCTDIDGESRILSGRLKRLTTPSPGSEYYLFTLEDKTTEKSAQRRLINDILTDPLTGLLTHNAFVRRLSEQMKSRKNRDIGAVFNLNIDRFQQVNESLGFDAGDEVLKAVARTLEEMLPTPVLLSRLNCDEFTIYAPGIRDELEARSIADEIHSALAGSPVTVKGQMIHISIAIGVALQGANTHNGEDLVRNAIMAMHRAKSRGRGRTEVFKNEFRQRAHSVFTLEADLREAIRSNALELNYQPVCNIRTGELLGFEALARWTHPERGPISPVDFIPLAESNGLILPIGEWALNEACTQLAEWDESGLGAGKLTMNVNVSGIQFAESGFLDTVRQSLARSGLGGDRLRLEITESTIMSNAELVADLLLDLKSLGVHLAVDDFGTGYSSLSYLSRFPIDTLKIDRSFVKKIDETADDAKIIHIITSLAQTLGMATVAEGVETPMQREKLIALGCGLAQGYLFARPLPAAEATTLVRDGQNLPIAAQ